MVGVGIVGGHVLLQRSGAAAIEEIYRHTRLAASVGRGQSAGEVRCQIHSCAVDGTWCEDAGDNDTDVRGSV